MLELAPQLQAALAAGHTVVVPSAQRAAAVRLGYATAQLAAGHRAFRTPDVQSLDGWLRGQRPRAADGPPQHRLGASEEWLLWHEAVNEAATQLGLPRIAGLAEAVRRAAGLLHAWRIDPAALIPAATPETQLLAVALDGVEARLSARSAIGSWQILTQLARDPPRHPPLLAGFGEPTPALRALLDAWSERGRPARLLEGATEAAPGAYAPAPDAATELAWAAQWCRERLSAQPSARLLVIVPDLSLRRGEVRRLFDAVLDPAYLERGAVEAETPVYALEGGQPLAQYPPVAEALRTLDCLHGEADLAELSQWLRSSRGTQPGPVARAKLDVWLRSVVPPRLGLPQLLKALRAAPPALLASADELAQDLERLREAAGRSPSATFAQWCMRFAAVLAAGGLTAAATRHRNSHTQQVLQRLDELLQECAQLRGESEALGAGQALALFKQLLARTQFEPATGDAPVTITAALTDPIVRYDGIWACGLHTGTLPPGARFDPFIPASVQRAAGITHADAAALVLQSQHGLTTLACRAGEFIVSSPAQDQDRELTRSPLLTPFSAQHYVPAVAPDPGQQIRATRRMQHQAEEPGLPWPAQRAVPAGTFAIELQSRCPFRAYAQLRLGAVPLEEPVPGITPAERGRLLHRALQLLWERLGGSVGLAAARARFTLAREIEDCVAQAAEEVLQKPDPDEPDAALSAAADATGLLTLRRAAIGREQGRARRLIQALCEVEAGRGPFTAVALESSRRWETGGARIDLRIDRIDRLADGSHAILDYKTGRIQTLDWEEGRTTHPQLLVYLLAAGVPVSTLAVVYLDPKSVAFKGISDQDLRLPGVKGLIAAQPDAAAGLWEAQRAQWQAQVEQLAAHFVAGDARVDPADGACEICHLHAFCRIAEHTAAIAQSETEAEEAP